MAHTTTINRPFRHLRVPNRTYVTMGVILIIGAVLFAMLAALYMSYRGVPETGTPGRIDNATGVQPQYPPATPAEPPGTAPAPPAR